MNERDWSDRFSRDVDGLLGEAGRADAEAMPAEYSQALNLARALATTDFSGESQVRYALRRRLLSQMDTREGWSLRKEIAMRTFLWKRHPVLAAVSVVLVVALVVVLAWPGALPAVAQGIETFVENLVLGRHTSVSHTSVSLVHPDLAATRAQKLPPKTLEIRQLTDTWVIRTAIGNFGGNLLPGWDAIVRQFSTFDEAQAAASFRLRQPGYLPSGYALREVMIAPPGQALLFYDGPSGDIVLVQTAVGEERVGEIKQGNTITTTVDVRTVQVLTDDPIISVTLNGQPAAWIENHGLKWEVDGVSYTLGGSGLSLEETIRIAESLE